MSNQPEHPDTPVRRLPGAARAQAFNEPAMEEASPVVPFTPPLVPPHLGTASLYVTPPPSIASPPAVMTPDQGSDSGEQWRNTAQLPVAGGGAPAVYPGGWTPPPPREKPAEWGRKRQIVRVLSLGLAHAKAGQEELQYRENIRAVREGSWPRCARIVVANPKGGVGKTPVAVALGGMLAKIRGGGVVVWDAADAAGTVGSRAEGRPGRCISEVDAHPESYGQPGTIAAATAPQSSFADVLGSLQDREFTEASVQRVLWALDRSYRMSVADTGNVPHSPAFREVMSRADLVVVPTTITKDSVDKATSLLRKMQDSPTGLLQRAVVAVLENRGPQTPGLAAAMDEIFHGEGVGAVVHIPFEPVIAAGTAITLGDFTHESTVAWTHLAAACTTNLITAPERN